MTSLHNGILILDYGSQYTQLIARRVRESHVYCEIHPPLPVDAIRRHAPRGIVLSGGPNSVYEEGAPQLDAATVDLGIPVLGVCYGMYLVALAAGGTVEAAGEREYGRAELEIRASDALFGGFSPGEHIQVWMSHGDRVTALPDGFALVGSSGNSPIAAFASRARRLFGVQFHPEVAHTPRGGRSCGTSCSTSVAAPRTGQPDTSSPSRSRPSVHGSVQRRGSSADCPAGSTPRWRRCWYIGRSAIA